MRYLIEAYSNTGETVLDFTMGSGTTGVACVDTSRNFIGVEKDKEIYQVACTRMEIEQVQAA
jgi:site-specific DNA-methyltransferase (adenine-specific)